MPAIGWLRLAPENFATIPTAVAAAAVVAAVAVVAVIIIIIIVVAVVILVVVVVVVNSYCRGTSIMVISVALKFW